MNLRISVSETGDCMEAFRRKKRRAKGKWKDKIPLHCRNQNQRKVKAEASARFRTLLSPVLRFSLCPTLKLFRHVP